MKFKKGEKAFDNIEDARAVYCNGLHKREACAIYRVLTHGKCRELCEENPRKAAELMEFEIIDDEPATQELPIDISGMTAAQMQEYCNRLKASEPWKDCNSFTRESCELIKHNMCAGNWKIKLEPLRLTPKELCICKAVCAKWVSMDDTADCKSVRLWGEKPSFGGKIFFPYSDCLANTKKELFPSVRHGDYICVDDAGG